MSTSTLILIGMIELFLIILVTLNTWEKVEEKKAVSKMLTSEEIEDLVKEYKELSRHGR